MTVAKRGSRRLFRATALFPRQPHDDVAVALAGAAHGREAVHNCGIDPDAIVAVGRPLRLDVDFARQGRGDHAAKSVTKKSGRRDRERRGLPGVRSEIRPFAGRSESAIITNRYVAIEL